MTNRLIILVALVISQSGVALYTVHLKDRVKALERVVETDHRTSTNAFAHLISTIEAAHAETEEDARILTDLTKVVRDFYLEFKGNKKEPR